jgi:hypothetical protein
MDSLNVCRDIELEERSSYCRKGENWGVVIANSHVRVRIMFDSGGHENRERGRAGLAAEKSETGAQNVEPEYQRKGVSVEGVQKKGNA